MSRENRYMPRPWTRPSNYSDKEWESASESWASMSVRDRYELIKRVGNCSVFAARHDYMPDDDRIQEILRSWA